MPHRPVLSHCIGLKSGMLVNFLFRFSTAVSSSLIIQMCLAIVTFLPGHCSKNWLRWLRLMIVHYIPHHKNIYILTRPSDPLWRSCKLQNKEEKINTFWMMVVWKQYFTIEPRLALNWQSFCFLTTRIAGMLYHTQLRYLKKIEDRFLCSSGCLQAHHLAKDDTEPLILQPLSSKHREYRHTPWQLTLRHLFQLFTSLIEAPILPYI